MIDSERSSFSLCTFNCLWPTCGTPWKPVWEILTCYSAITRVSASSLYPRIVLKNVLWGMLMILFKVLELDCVVIWPWFVALLSAHPTGMLVYATKHTTQHTAICLFKKYWILAWVGINEQPLFTIVSSCLSGILRLNELLSFEDSDIFKLVLIWGVASGRCRQFTKSAY